MVKFQLNSILSTIKNYWIFFKEINFSDTSKNLKKCDVLLFCHDANRGIDLEGKAYSPLLDSIQEELNKDGLSTQTIAHPWSKLFGEKAFGNVFSINRSYFFAILKVKIFKKDFCTPLYEKILQQASPSRIISIGCNDGLCKAARMLGIPHAELLHGIGYGVIPWGWDTKSEEFLPQEVLSLDVVSTRTFSFLERNNIKITQIHHPFLKRFNKNNDKWLPKEWRLNSLNIYEKEVLFSFQWGYDHEIGCLKNLQGILPNGLFPEEIISVIKKTKNKILWRFRFHPVQLRMKSKYKKHFDLINKLVKENENCEWEESSTKPLPAILYRCDAHVTMFSMSAYEAAYMGVKTLTLCPTVMEGGSQEYYFLDLVDKKYVTKMKPNEQEIFDWIIDAEKTDPIFNFN